MFASGKSVSSGEIPDTYFNNVPLLLTTTSAASDGSTNASFLDSSSNNISITRNGTPTQGTFSPFGSSAGEWSMYFDGSTYINFTGLNAYLTTGPCTIEAWINFSSFATSPTIVHNYNWNFGNNCGWSFTVGTDGRLAVGGSNGTYNTGVTVVQTTSVVTVGRWYHVAFVRDAANLCKIYINGVDGGGSNTYAASLSQNYNTSFRGTELGRIVADGGTYDQTTGFISNLRIVNGTAVYTGNFTPPDPLTNIANTTLLFANSASPKDNSSNNYAYTVSGTQRVNKFHPFKKISYNPSLRGGSGYFNGSTDYLSLPAASQYNLTGSFTVECWFYLTSTPPNNNNGTPTASLAIYWSTNLTGSQGFEFNVTTGASGSVTFSKAGSGTGMIGSYTSFILNSWYHVAATYNGTTGAIYLNGTALTLSTNNWAWTAISGTPILRIGGSVFAGGYNHYFPGYISNFRILNGSVAYTGNFTPSTTPVTNIANTSLLCDFTNGAIVDYATVNNGYLLADARAKVISPTAKFGSTAMAFDGSGDYLTFPSNSVFAFGTGDFAIEAWVYSNDVSGATQRGWIQTSDTAGGLKTTYTTGVVIYFGAGAAGVAFTGGVITNVAGTIIGISSAVVTAGTWNHIAVTRASGTVRIFVNGTLTTSGTAAGDCSGANLVVGGYYNTSYLLNGNIQDLRITKGVARYTSNFTVPAQLPRS